MTHAGDRPTGQRNVEMTRWVTFGVIFGLLPLVLRFMIVYFHSPAAPDVWPTIKLVMENGELLLISCCIGGTAIGERFGRSGLQPPQSPKARTELWCALGCLFSVIISSFYYALVLAGLVQRVDSVAVVSMWLFGLTMVASAVLMNLILADSAGGKA